MSDSWRHPAHHSPRSQSFSNIRGAILTDKKIDQYIAAGRYGAKLQRALLASRKKPKKTKKPNPLVLAMRALLE